MALRAAVYSQLPQSVRDKELRQDLAWLQRAMVDQGPLRGLYGYGLAQGRGQSQWGDLSNSQYGVLGVWYASMAGLEVPLEYWRKVETAWLRGRTKTADSEYRPGHGRKVTPQ